MSRRLEVAYPPLIRNTHLAYLGEPQLLQSAPYTIEAVRENLQGIMAGQLYLARPPGGYDAYIAHIADLRARGVLKQEEILRETQGQVLALTRNRFPYHMVKGVYHSVYWINGGDEVLPQAEIFLHDTMYAWGVRPSRVVWWQNNPTTSSIPGVSHFQVMFEARSMPSLPRFGNIFQYNA